MLHKNLKSFSAAAAFGAGAALLLGAGHVRSANAESQGKTLPWQAMKIATNAVHGKALMATYAFEEGHWIYDVIVAKGKTLKEVEINAVTGKMDPPETVTPEDEAKEFASDLNAAIGNKPAKSAGTDTETNDGNN